MARYYIANVYDSFNMPRVRLFTKKELPYLRQTHRVEILMTGDDWKEINRAFREEYL